MVVLRGYDPTQPNKTSFSAPPATYNPVDANFIYSGMVVRRNAGTMVPAIAADMLGHGELGTITPAQLGFAFQDSDRFDIQESRVANAFSQRSDGEIRTAWFDRSVVYAIDDPLCVGALGQLTKLTNSSTELIVGRVSALPRFEGGNPRIGNVNYTYANTLPVAPYAAAPAVAVATSTNVDAMKAFNVLLNAWILANIPVAARPAGYAFDTTGVLDTSSGDAGFGGPNASDYGTFALSYNAAVAYGAGQALVRQAASDISSLQATDNSMLTFVTSRS